MAERVEGLPYRTFIHLRSRKIQKAFVQGFCLIKEGMEHKKHLEGIDDRASQKEKVIKGDWAIFTATAAIESLSGPRS